MKTFHIELTRAPFYSVNADNKRCLLLSGDSPVIVGDTLEITELGGPGHAKRIVTHVETIGLTLLVSVAPTRQK